MRCGIAVGALRVGTLTTSTYPTGNAARSPLTCKYPAYNQPPGTAFHQVVSNTLAHAPSVLLASRVTHSSLGNPPTVEYSTPGPERSYRLSVVQASRRCGWVALEGG